MTVGRAGTDTKLELKQVDSLGPEVGGELDVDVEIDVDVGDKIEVGIDRSCAVANVPAQEDRNNNAIAREEGCLRLTCWMICMEPDSLWVAGL